MRRVVRLMIVGLMVAVVVTPSVAGAKGSKPWKATTAGTSTSSAVGTTVTSVSNGSGNFSHAGKSAYQFTTTQDWSGYTPSHPCGDITSGTATITAANGDQVTGTLDGEVCEHTPPSEAAYDSSLVMTVTGGTGRFTGATGMLTGGGSSVATGPGTFSDTGSFTGTLSY